MRKIIFLIIIIFSFQLSPELTSQWFTVWQGNHDMWSACFVNQYTGWVTGGNQLIMRTTNGGLNWNTQYDAGNRTLYSIFFIDQNTGWGVGGSWYPSYLSLIIKTNNGGLNWFYQTSANSVQLSDVFFINPNTGWAVGGVHPMQGTIIKTTDGGNNWFSQYLSSARTFGKVTFIDYNTGWISGIYQIIMKTTDGGNNWFDLNTGFNSYITSIVFKDHNYGFAVGSPGIILKTTNGGINWLNQFQNYDFSSTFFVNVNTGWVVGDNGQNGIILKTTNSGTNWIFQDTPLTGLYFNSVSFGDSNTGCVAAGRDFFNGMILCTTNGGTTVGINNISNKIPLDIALHKNYPNPFNPSTHIRYDISRSSFVRLVVYDVLGRQVSVLVNEQLKPGEYESVWTAENMSGGVYFYKLTANNPSTSSGLGFSETRRMVVVK